MKAKTLFITLFLLLQMQSLFPQCISIELSVTWEMGSHIFYKDSIVSIPMLNITYRNHCDTNYYFFKVSSRKEGELIVLCPAMRTFAHFDLLKRAKAHHNYAKQNFYVIIEKTPWYNIGWDIDNDTGDYDDKNHIINVKCCLDDIYRYIRSENNNTTTNQKKHWYFVQSILTIENILSGSVQDQFVFLNSGEVYTDTYNLIGYKLVEGCFTFLIGQNEIKNYVITYDESIEQEFELPAKVGEYQRYSGAFNTNKVTVCFGEEE